MLGKEAAVESEDLGDIDDRIAGKTRQIGPPDFSAPNVIHEGYQEPLSSDLSWARCNAEATFAGRREYTSFRRSMTAPVCRRSRNSEMAMA